MSRRRRQKARARSHRDAGDRASRPAEALGAKAVRPDDPTALAGTGAAGPDDATRPARPSGAAATPAAEADVAALWEPGDLILGLYEVLDVHTGGGMGLVYRVRHTAWNVELAVKSPRPEYFESEGDKQRFEREARTWVDLGLHPNLVACHYVRRLGGIPRVFAEYVHGGSLADWVADRRLYGDGAERALERILDVAIQSAWGLAYAHERGLVHRDVKPANVMLEPDGQVKVTDFGLAGARAAAGECGRPHAGLSPLASHAGMTPAYCSPEQAEAQAAHEAGEEAPGLTLATDVWSWAVSVLALFIGRPPCERGQLADHALAAYLEQGAGDPAIPPMPNALAQLLGRCLTLEPERRPQTLALIADELTHIYAQALGDAYPRGGPEPARLLADSLSNQALSMLDLGDEERAEELFAQALAADPHHPHTTYNQGLHLWRNAEITDDELIRRLEQVRATHESDWVDEYLLALAHLERAHPGKAQKLLEHAASAAPDSEEIADALDLAAAGDQRARCRRRLVGHSGWIGAVALTADGRLAVSGSRDDTARIWETSSGRCMHILEGHGSRVSAVALTPDGRFAITGSYDSTARLWGIADGRCLHTLAGHTKPVTCVALTADGRHALTGSWDGTARLWDLATGTCVRILRGHKEWITSAALTPDGGAVLTGSDDKTARLWTLPDGRRIRTLRHTQSVAAVAVTADHRQALTASSGHSAHLWDLTTGRCLRTLAGHTGSISAAALTPDGAFALTGSDDTTVRVWELTTGRCRRTLTGHGAGVASVAITPDGRLALSAARDNAARLWELPARRVRHSPWAYARPHGAVEAARAGAAVRKAVDAADRMLARGEHREAAVQLRFARRTLGYERDPNVLERWKLAGRRGRRTELLGAWRQRAFEGLGHGSVALTADGRFALAPGDNGTACLWELGEGRCLRALEGHQSEVRAVAITANGQLALTGAEDESARLWEVASGSCLRVLGDHGSTVGAVALTPDGRLALTAAWDGTTRVWDLAGGECRRTLADQTNSVALTPDGRLGLTGTDEGARLWDLADGRCLRTLSHGEYVTAVAITPDGRRALTLSESEVGSARLWDLADGRCMHTFAGHGPGVASAALTADGRLALAGSPPRLWELDSGRRLYVLEGQREEIGSVALTRRGDLALTASRDGTVWLWELDWDYEFPEPADFDERARPQLELFISVHTRRSGTAAWSEADFEELLDHLADCGYGWLRPEGVRAELERMAGTGPGCQVVSAEPAPIAGTRRDFRLSRLFRRGG
jgi:WD40 repeat protein/serine/threonine protein kinase